MLHGAVIHAAFCLTFAGFLRINKMTYLTINLINLESIKWFITRRLLQLFNKYLGLTLQSSKTNLFRKGIILIIAAAGDSTCPVALLYYLVTVFPATPSSPLFYPGKAFTRYLVVDTLKGAMQYLRYTSRYSGHLYRRGAATLAREAGMSNFDIQLLGRYKSESYELYINTSPLYVLRASRRL